jgi:hypothetical protein
VKQIGFPKIAEEASKDEGGAERLPEQGRFQKRAQHNPSIVV